MDGEIAEALRHPSQESTPALSVWLPLSRQSHAPRRLFRQQSRSLPRIAVKRFRYTLEDGYYLCQMMIVFSWLCNIGMFMMFVRTLSTTEQD